MTYILQAAHSFILERHLGPGSNRTCVSGFSSCDEVVGSHLVVIKSIERSVSLSTKSSDYHFSVILRNQSSLITPLSTHPPIFHQVCVAHWVAAGERTERQHNMADSLTSFHNLILAFDLNSREIKELNLSIFGDRVFNVKIIHFCPWNVLPVCGLSLKMDSDPLIWNSILFILNPFQGNTGLPSVRTSLSFMDLVILYFHKPMNLTQYKMLFLNLKKIIYKM